MTARQQLARLLPLALLVVLVIAGLRGAVPVPGWNGPLRADGVAIGIALEVILGALLLIVRRRDAVARRAAERQGRAGADREIEPPEGLRFALRYVLGMSMAAIAAVLISNLHLHFFGGLHALRPPRIAKIGSPKQQATGHPQVLAPHIPVGVIMYALLIAALVAAVAISLWWSSRLRRPAAPLVIGDVSTEELREAVESGRSALAGADGARAAIIACYLAMERSLAERGTARAVADTPDELLARAVAAGVVRGGAASRLTALFYEARFSTHQVGDGQRDAASAALDELSAELAAGAAARQAAEAAARQAAEAAARPGGGWV